jgi:putative transposase
VAAGDVGGAFQPVPRRNRPAVPRPFQGRYKALHVEPGHSLAQVAHYIHLNPVRAKTTTAERVAEYRWSSLHYFLRKDRPACLEPATVLTESGGLPDTAGGWRRYLNYLDVLAEEDGKRRAGKFGRLSRGWMIGSPAFKTELQQQLKGIGGERFELLGSDRQAHREVRGELWEAKLQQLAKALEIDLSGLPEPKSASDKVKLAAAMKQVTSVSNRWLTERLAMGEPASVSQFVRRFNLNGGPQARAFKGAVSKVKP